VTNTDKASGKSLPAQSVATFHLRFGLHRQSHPSVEIDPALADLRVKLLQEEVDEFSEASKKRDIVEIADALADIVYVAYGAAINYGIDLDAVIEEVHNSNMTKLDDDGSPVFREDGKVGKSPNYRPPDVAAVLMNQPPLEL
jgi:predicted HAD superfamily Cof-like phosphohydrolase